MEDVSVGPATDCSVRIVGTERKSDLGIEISCGRIRNEAADFEGTICHYVSGTRKVTWNGPVSTTSDEGWDLKTSEERISRRENESAATWKIRLATWPKLTGKRSPRLRISFETAASFPAVSVFRWDFDWVGPTRVSRRYRGETPLIPPSFFRSSFGKKIKNERRQWPYRADTRSRNNNHGNVVRPSVRPPRLRTVFAHRSPLCRVIIYPIRGYSLACPEPDGPFETQTRLMCVTRQNG